MSTKPRCTLQRGLSFFGKNYVGVMPPSYKGFGEADE